MNASPEIPGNDDIAREKDPTRRAIVAAIQRILLGQPKIVPPGATSISHLAQEAQVGRHHLYQSHPDLKDRYEYLRDRSRQPTEKELGLRHELDEAKAKITKLGDLQARTHERSENWKSLAEIFERAINVLQEELRQEQIRAERLARKLKSVTEESPTAPVIPMRKRPAR